MKARCRLFGGNVYTHGITFGKSHSHFVWLPLSTKKMISLLMSTHGWRHTHSWEVKRWPSFRLWFPSDFQNPNHKNCEESPLIWFVWAKKLSVPLGKINKWVFLPFHHATDKKRLECCGRESGRNLTRKSSATNHPAMSLIHVLVAAAARCFFRLLVPADGISLSLFSTTL